MQSLRHSQPVSQMSTTCGCIRPKVSPPSYIVGACHFVSVSNFAVLLLSILVSRSRVFAQLYAPPPGRALDLGLQFVLAISCVYAADSISAYRGS